MKKKLIDFFPELTEGKIWTDSEKAELANLFHTAQTALLKPGTGKPRPSRYERMQYAAKWFAKKHPEVSSTAAYKELSRSARRVNEATMHPARQKLLLRRLGLLDKVLYKQKKYDATVSNDDTIHLTPISGGKSVTLSVTNVTDFETIHPPGGWPGHQGLVYKIW